MKRANKITYKQGNDYLRVLRRRGLPILFSYKRLNKFCCLLLISMVFLIFYSMELTAQDSSQTAPEFLIGTFVHLSADPEYTRYNYDTVLSLGVNSVLQLGVKDVQRLNQDSNLEELTVFHTVYAANDSGTGTGVEGIDAKWENVDWISYFTNAKYRKWEAEGDSVLFNGYVQIKHADGGVYYQEPVGTEGWKTNSQNQPGDLIINGPDYWQYPRYTFTNPAWNPAPILYKAAFRMKIDSIPENPQQVCKIMVTNTDSDGVETVIKDSVLTTAELDTDYNKFILEYNYSDYFNNTATNYNYTPLPGDYASEDSYGYNQGSKVQFKVVWLGNRELFVDFIEVFDYDIWDIWFKQFPGRMVDSIINYNQGFATLGTKLKHYTTIDEPGSIDCYEPLRKVQFILDSLNINADLLTHWYPGWNGKYEGNGGDFSLPVYYQLAQPKKLYFWYAPYSIPSGDVPDPRDFTLYQLRVNLQWAHLRQPDFYIAAQTFGIKEPNGDWYRWMTPDTAEVGAETMLSLAHGVKGIYYELYYSYNSGDRKVEGLVDFPGSGFAKRDIWFKVQELTSRLKGIFGQTLMTLDYDAANETDGFLMLRRFIHQSASATVNDRYLTLSSINPNTDTLNFHAGFFKNPNLGENNYFLLANLYTSASREVNITVTNNFSNYNNMRFRNIEPQFNFDTTFVESINIAHDFPAGEGYLFQVAPVVKYGGRLIYDEEISSETLYDDMIIENGAALSISGNYDADADIIVKDGGRIVNTGNGKITFHNGHKLILQGNSTLSSLSQSKLVLDFVSPSVNNGIIAGLGLVINISNCEIKNAGTGITVLSFSSSVPESEDFRFRVDSVDFIDCEEFGINITGKYVNKVMIENSRFTVRRK